MLGGELHSEPQVTVEGLANLVHALVGQAAEALGEAVDREGEALAQGFARLGEARLTRRNRRRRGRPSW